jgi:hypothetical protein
MGAAAAVKGVGREADTGAPAENVCTDQGEYQGIAATSRFLCLVENSNRAGLSAA